ncbi:MAG: NAD-dependent DNA ligase LigA [Haloferacaceae archaeon]
MVEAPEDNPYVREPDLDVRDVGALSRPEAEREVERLREAIDYHDHRYYVENDPVIADETYDALFDRLEALEAAFDLADENSPTRRVGGRPLESLPRREHVAAMLSLDSSESAADVRAFDDRVRDAVGAVTYSLEPKFDGLSMEFVYLDGDLDRAVTRGDGRVGEDVTENARTIHTLPLRLADAPDLLAVRGEVYMPRSAFHDLNDRRIRNGEEPFANPRNAAAGSVRLLDPTAVADRPLAVYVYDLVDCSRDVGSQTEAFDLMRAVGLRVSEDNRVGETVEEVVAYRDEMLARRDDLEFDVDGVVAKVDEFDRRERLGTTAAHPRWAFAYKFPARTGETTVRRIVVQVGRTGKLTPVALLDPVDVRGVTISRATLHNERRARELGIGAGATVTVERAGDVIPEIASVIEPAAGTFEMPETCPVCGSAVVREGENHFCTGGVTCPAQLARSIQHFCSTAAMDVEGVGETVAGRLVESGLVSSVADLYALDVEDLADLEPFGETSARTLLDGIEASKDVDLASFVYALGIRHVGTERARALSRRFSLAELQDASVDELEAVEDVGPEVAASVRSFFDNDANRAVVRRLLDAGVAPTRAPRGREFAGVSLAFTGRVDGFTREEITSLMERHGATVTSAVGEETDYLVVGESPGETKLAAADELAVETLDAGEFEARFLRDLDADG